MQTGELDLQFAFISEGEYIKWLKVLYLLMQTILVLRIDPTLESSLACCFAINQMSCYDFEGLLSILTVKSSKMPTDSNLSLMRKCGLNL
jgi:hypothetical protein